MFLCVSVCICNHIKFLNAHQAHHLMGPSQMPVVIRSYILNIDILLLESRSSFYFSRYSKRVINKTWTFVLHLFGPWTLLFLPAQYLSVAPVDTTYTCSKWIVLILLSIPPPQPHIHLIFTSPRASVLTSLLFEIPTS